MIKGLPYTSVPDFVLDFVMPRTSHCEFKVFMYILRRTRGFQKESDSISMTQFVRGIKKRSSGEMADEGTGLSKAGVKNGISGLLKKQYIFRGKSGRNCFPWYSINWSGAGQVLSLTDSRDQNLIPEGTKICAADPALNGQDLAPQKTEEQNTAQQTVSPADRPANPDLSRISVDEEDPINWMRNRLSREVVGIRGVVKFSQTQESEIRSWEAQVRRCRGEDDVRELRVAVAAIYLDTPDPGARAKRIYGLYRAARTGTQVDASLKAGKQERPANTSHTRTSEEYNESWDNWQGETDGPS